MVDHDDARHARTRAQRARAPEPEEERMNRDLAEHPLQRAATFQDVERAARDARVADAPPPPLR
ncbi:hypothetical protein, partial [Burkholderia oklahomensis]|uniref:hypothetical protein n=1 Tax=Burkholderia oklahomensis TaxID=342113 RepID=UPI0039F5A396